MFSSDERMVVWVSLMVCMTLLHRHMALVALIGPTVSVSPTVEEETDEDEDEVDADDVTRD